MNGERIRPCWLWDDRKKALSIVDVMDSLGVRHDMARKLAEDIPHCRIRECKTSKIVIDRKDFTLWLLRNPKWKNIFYRRMLEEERRATK